MKKRVLFLCATNGVQSPMAEMLLRRIDPDHFEAHSAGTEPGELHPLTVQVMNEIGVDLSKSRTRKLEDVRDVDFDFVITLCHRVRSHPLRFNHTELIHWQFDDPTADSVDADRRIRRFRAVRDQIAQRINLFALVHARRKPAAMAAASR